MYLLNKSIVCFLATIIQLMIINMIQVRHRLIRLMQVTNQGHLMHHQEHMMDMQHQQHILQVKYVDGYIKIKQFCII
jgi:hypothetical protein